MLRGIALALFILSACCCDHGDWIFIISFALAGIIILTIDAVIRYSRKKFRDAVNREVERKLYSWQKE